MGSPPKILIVGVDPGCTGGIAVLNPVSRVAKCYPLRKDPVWVRKVVANLPLEEGAEVVIYRELVRGLPGDTPTTACMLCKTDGWLEMAFLSFYPNITQNRIDPRTWQYTLKLAGKWKTYAARKKGLWETARRWFPTASGLTRQTADALLIAAAGAVHELNSPGRSAKAIPRKGGAASRSVR